MDYTAEDKRQHLAFIQDIIKRMASDSFAVKGWAITGISALYAFWVNSHKFFLLLIITAILIFAWLQDTYFLQQERKFRALYSRVAKNNKKFSNYSMNIGPTAFSCEELKKEKLNYFRTMFSITLNLSYGIILGITVIITIVDLLGGK